MVFWRAVSITKFVKTQSNEGQTIRNKNQLVHKVKFMLLAWVQQTMFIEAHDPCTFPKLWEGDDTLQMGTRLHPLGNGRAYKLAYMCNLQIKDSTVLHGVFGVFSMLLHHQVHKLVQFIQSHFSSVGFVVQFMGPPQTKPYYPSVYFKNKTFWTFLCVRIHHL